MDTLQLLAQTQLIHGPWVLSSHLVLPPFEVVSWAYLLIVSRDHSSLVIGTRTSCTFVHDLYKHVRRDQHWTRATCLAQAKQASCAFVCLLLLIHVSHVFNWLTASAFSYYVLWSLGGAVVAPTSHSAPRAGTTPVQAFHILSN